MTDDGVQIREDVDLQVDLTLVATPAASKAQFQDVNRLRKPTSEELKIINNNRHVAMNAPNADELLQVSEEIAKVAGGGKPAEVIKDIGTGMKLIRDAREEKRQNGRVSGNTVGRFVNFGLRFAR